jgi:hypothetical protein
VTSGAIIDLDGEPEARTGADRRRAVALGFALCLAVGSAFVGRDDSTAISERPTTLVICDRTGDQCVPATAVDSWVMFAPQSWGALPSRTVFDRTLTLPANTTDVQLQVFPDWLANEQLPPAQYTPVRIRAASGLAVDAVRPGDQRMITWTELGTVYWLYSDRRDIADLVRLADSLR